MIRVRFQAALAVLGLALFAVAPAMAEDRAPVPEGLLTVDDAVRIALMNNNQYLRAAAAVDVAAGTRMDALARLLPGISASGDWSKQDGSRTTDPFISREADGTVTQGRIENSGDSSTLTGRVSLDERIGLSSIYGLSSASKAQGASKWSSEAAAQETAFQVRQQYYLVIRAQDLTQVQEEDLRLARDEERRIRSMFELGSVARVDVLKAEVRVADAEVVLIRQQNQLQRERFQLARMLGFGPLTRLDLSADLEQPGFAALDSAQAVSDALGRPDVLAAQLNYESADAGAKSEGFTRLPDLFANFGYSTSSGNSNSQGEQAFGGVVVPNDTESEFSSDGWSATVGLTVSLDALLNSGRVKRAGALKRQAEYDLEEQRLLAVQELADAVITYRAALKSLGAAQRGVDSAQEDYRLSQERYTQGLGTILDLLSSQVDLTRARNQLVDSQAALRIAEASVNRARGTPLPR